MIQDIVRAKAVVKWYGPDSWELERIKQVHYCLMKYKQLNHFDARALESRRIRYQYPNRIPVICETYGVNSDIPELDKKKYLIPYDLTAGQFMLFIRKRLKLRAEKGIFLLVNGKIQVAGSDIMRLVYERNIDEDGFLYCTIAGENDLG